MATHSNENKRQEEFIELLDHGYVVKRGSTEVCRRVYRSRRSRHHRCAEKKALTKFTKRLRQKRKRNWGKKKKFPEVGPTNVQGTSQPLQQPARHAQTSESISNPPVPESEPALQSESDPGIMNMIDEPIQMSQHLNEVAESPDDTSRMESEPSGLAVPQSYSVTQLDVSGDGNNMVDVVKKIGLRITSAYHYLGVMTEDVVGLSPAVRMEAEPTNLADPNAIKLLFQAKDGEWVHGGYIPREQTQRVRDLGDSIIGIRVAYWGNRGYWREPYVQLLYKARIRRVAATKETLLTPSVVTEQYWVGVHSLKHATRERSLFGKWLVFVDVGEKLDSVWHRVAYAVENGQFGKGCTVAKCSTAKDNPHCSDSSQGVIVVYTTKSAADHVGFQLSKLTRVPNIYYKTNAATMAGVYAGDPGCTTKTISNYIGIPRLRNNYRKGV